MKFLVDAQLPKSLSDFLVAQGIDSIHTLELPEKNRTKDNFIAQLATTENRIVISKDSDFLESYILRKQPPKLLLITTGNIRNSELLVLFEKHWPLIAELFINSSLIELNRNEIVVHS